MLSTLARGVSLTASALKGRVSVAAFSTIEPSKLEIVRTKTPAAKTDKEKLAFGAVKTDHMLEIDWDHKDGWSAPRITPYHPLQIDPAASCLHYGLEVRARVRRLGAAAFIYERTGMPSSAVRSRRARRRIATTAAFRHAS